MKNFLKILNQLNCKNNKLLNKEQLLSISILETKTKWLFLNYHNINILLPISAQHNLIYYIYIYRPWQVINPKPELTKIVNQYIDLINTFDFKSPPENKNKLNNMWRRIKIKTRYTLQIISQYKYTQLFLYPDTGVSIISVYLFFYPDTGVSITFKQSGCLFSL